VIFTAFSVEGATSEVRLRRGQQTCGVRVRVALASHVGPVLRRLLGDRFD